MRSLSLAPKRSMCVPVVVKQCCADAMTVDGEYILFPVHVLSHIVTLLMNCHYLTEHRNRQSTVALTTRLNHRMNTRDYCTVDGYVDSSID